MSSMRENILACRNDLSLAKQREFSDKIERKLLLQDVVLKCHVIFVYVSFRSEVQTHTLIQKLLQQGKQVVVPVTVAANKKLIPVIIHNFNELNPGYCSILEPRPEIRATQQIFGADIDLVLLPGSVFDIRGGRMGYGGGYYDRFLANEAPQSLRIGLAYDLQVVDKIDLQAHDELVDLIVTEKRIIQGERYQGGGGETKNSHF